MGFFCGSGLIGLLDWSEGYIIVGRNVVGLLYRCGLVLIEGIGCVLSMFKELFKRNNNISVKVPNLLIHEMGCMAGKKLLYSHIYTNGLFLV